MFERNRHKSRILRFWSFLIHYWYSFPKELLIIGLVLLVPSCVILTNLFEARTEEGSLCSKETGTKVGFYDCGVS